MPAQWLSKSSNTPARIIDGLEALLHRLAQPAVVRRIRRVLVLLLALWAVLALSGLIWSLLSVSPTMPEAGRRVINPVSSTTRAVAEDSVDVERMAAWHLFGEAGVQAQETPDAVITPAAASVRDGIEEGARETRLDLKLRGVVASSEDGLGHAIIEYRSKQAIYAVEDKLPVSDKVVLAKVMPRQVVLDNGGTYELLALFEDSAMDGLSSKPPRTVVDQSAAGQLDKTSDAEATALARSYRERLYQNPQSLAEVVNVSAVREGGELLGYRIAPGKDRAQFEQLGFKAGDLVTGVNGVALDNPANTMRLYQLMRSASAAEFELQRQGQALTVSVSLDNGATQ